MDRRVVCQLRVSVLIKLLRDLLRSSSPAGPRDGKESSVALALATRLQETAKWAEAEVVLRGLLHANPDHAKATLDLGTCLRHLGRVDEAIDCFERAAILDESMADAHLNRANFALQRGEIDAALHLYDRVLEISPLETGVLAKRAELLMVVGRPEEGVASLRRAIETDPAQSQLHSTLLLWLNLVPGTPRDALLQEHRDWAERHAESLGSERRTYPNQADPMRRLRIGYVSPYLYRQPVGYFMEPILRCHDLAQFDVFVYSDTAYQDDATARMRLLNLHWCESAQWDDARLEQAIIEDSIDILIDLTGHNAGGRLQMFARKPAPVQISYLGYLSTTGLTAMNYRMTDTLADPPGTERYYSERLLRLPGAQWCYQPDPMTPAVSVLPALARGYVTFGSFHSSAKLNPSLFSTWAALLQKLPQACLLVVGVPNGSAVERLHQAFGTHGIARARVRTLPLQGYEDYLRLYGEVDIVLDSFPYNGATTTCEALWMGVPVVTLAGDAGATRSGISLLHGAGLPQLAAKTADEYVQIACTLAADLELLARLRSGLRERLRQSPIMDAAGFTRGIETAYRSVWCEWCAQSR